MQEVTNPPDLNWTNVDVATEDDIFFSERLRIVGGAAVVYRKDNSPIVSGEVAGWRHIRANLYRATLASGETWEIVKLRCRCNDHEKSGRIW